MHDDHSASAYAERINEDVYEKVKAQFDRTAQAYVESTVHAKGDDLRAMLELAGNVSGKQVLDLATGGGHTALAFAKAGAAVTATDLTPQMLHASKTHLSGQGVTGVTFQETNAEKLPFADLSFDIVTCHIAAHHFANPVAFVRESARVLKAAGTFLLVDNIAPEDADLAETMNRIEKIRDSSHVRAYSVKTWMVWLSEAGLEPCHLSRFRRTKAFEPWTTRAQLPEEAREELENYILSLPETHKRYLEVVERCGRLESLAHEVVFLAARKTSTG